MSEIIDFNELKNKVKESDVDKFEDYMYSLYSDVASGNLSMAGFSRKMMDYMRENNISQEKFYKIQQKFMERYGIDTKEMDDQLKKFGLDPEKISGISSSNPSQESVDRYTKASGFYDKYSHKIKIKSNITSYIKNDLNDLEIIIEEDKVILCSDKKIDLSDRELNEFLSSYRNMFDKTIRVVLCETTKKYDYK